MQAQQAHHLGGEVHWRKYADGDVYKVKLRPGDGRDGVIEFPGPKWSLCRGDTVIGSCGIKTDIDGVGTIWAFFSEEARGEGRKILRFMWQRLDEAFRDVGYYRLQACVSVDRPEYAKFIEMIGFQAEGLMRNATPDKRSVWLYSRVK